MGWSEAAQWIGVWVQCKIIWHWFFVCWNLLCVWQKVWCNDGFGQAPSSTQPARLFVCSGHLCGNQCLGMNQSSPFQSWIWKTYNCDTWRKNLNLFETRPLFPISLTWRSLSSMWVCPIANYCWTKKVRSQTEIWTIQDHIMVPICQKCAFSDSNNFRDLL